MQVPVNADRDARMAEIAAHLGAGKLAKAQQCLDVALQAEPDDVPLLMLRAVAQVKQKLWEGAQTDFSRARALDPADPETWLGEGVCLAMRSEIPPALELLERMLELFPEFVRGRIQTARVYYKLVVLPKAKAHLDAALASDPNQAERKEIEELLKEQAGLDEKRYHRPDFESLRRAKAAQAP